MTHNHEGRGSSKSERNCDRGDPVIWSLEVCVLVNALEILLLLNKLLPRSEWHLCHPAVYARIHMRHLYGYNLVN